MSRSLASCWTIVVLACAVRAGVADELPVRVLESEASSEKAVGQARLYAGFVGYTRQVTTDSAEAQRWFDQGLQLLYGYNHDEAIRSFEKAAEIDPSCAMAWWGSAYARGLHINNPEMGEAQSRQADEAARRAVAALDRETAVERALVQAVRQRYQWPAPEDRTPLDQRYAEAMEAAWHQFPDDPDVGALFAESLMTLQPWDLWTGAGVPKGRALEIAAVLERTLAKAPLHPGANHFYIHAIEASPWPEKGIEAAERLTALVPGSGHLVHMPSAKDLTDEWKMGNNSAAEVIAIARTMAEGELAYREGDAESAFSLLRQAVTLDDDLRYDEPPGWMQPVRHALGALLLADDHPVEAEAVYRADLIRHPNNAWSLLGLQQALQAQQKTTEAERLVPQVQQAWARADMMPVASCYCHPDAREP
jgi:tetratricopeptide (TPR) repeat protein